MEPVTQGMEHMEPVTRTLERAEVVTHSRVPAWCNTTWNTVTRVTDLVTMGWNILVERDRERLEHDREHLERDMRAWERDLERWQHTVSQGRNSYAHAHSASRLLLVLWSRLLDPRKPKRPSPSRARLRRWRRRIVLLVIAPVAACWYWLGPWSLLLPSVTVTAYLLAQAARSEKRESASELRRKRTLAAALCVMRDRVTDERDGEGVFRGSRVTSSKIDDYGWSIELQLSPGSEVTSLASAANVIGSHYRAKRGTVTVAPLEHHGSYRVTRQLRNPFRLVAWPGATVTDVTRPAPIGVTATGSTFQVSLERHILIGGVTGAGKSGIVNVIMCVASRMVNVMVWGIDLKDGLELGPWEDVISRLADNQDKARKLLSAVLAEVHRRNGVMRRKGIRSWVPTREDPTLLILVDEFAELTGGLGALETIARTARAAGVWLIACTQHPTADVCPTQIRNQFGMVLGFRVQRAEHSKVLFGSGREEWDTSHFDEDTPGLFHAWTGGKSKPIPVRSYWVDDALVQSACASATCVIEPDADWLGLPDEMDVMTLRDALLSTLDDDPIPISTVMRDVTLLLNGDTPNVRTVQRELAAMEGDGEARRTGLKSATRWALGAPSDTTPDTRAD